jgi:hypothetical protein
MYNLQLKSYYTKMNLGFFYEVNFKTKHHATLIANGETIPL